MNIKSKVPEPHKICLNLLSLHFAVKSADYPASLPAIMMLQTQCSLCQPQKAMS